MDSLAVFFTASVLLALAPGPDNLFVLTLSLNHGRLAGLWVVAGLCSGLLVHTTIVALGVAALLAAYPLAIPMIKTIGAMYLLYLAWRYWQTEPVDSGTQAPRVLAARDLYMRGFVMNVSNPKVVVFFLAYLPQFIDITSAQPHSRIFLLGLIFILATVLVFGGIALAVGSYSAQFAGHARRRRLLSRTSGLVLALLAVNLFSDWI